MHILPAQLLLYLWMNFKIVTKDNINIEFELRGGSLLNSIQLTVEMDKTKIPTKNQLVPIILKAPLNIIKVGNFSIFYGLQGEIKWQLAREILISSSINPNIYKH